MTSIANKGRRRRRDGADALPPQAQSSLVFAFEPGFAGGGQTHAARVGPTATLGSTSGADTNDPTLSTAAPACYTFGVDDYLDFGDVLDSTWATTSGFSVLIAIDPSAGDVAAANRSILSKDATGALSWLCGLNATGKLEPFFNYTGGSIADYDFYTSNAALTSGKKVIGFSFDPSLARASRCILYVNGSSVAATHTLSGASGTSVANTAGNLTIGMDRRNTIQPIASIGPVYAYSGILTPANFLANSQWLAARGWA